MSVYKETFFGGCINCLKKIENKGVYCKKCGSEYHESCMLSIKYFNGKCGHCDNREFAEFPKNFKELLKSLPKVATSKQEESK